MPTLDSFLDDKTRKLLNDLRGNVEKIKKREPFVGTSIKRPKKDKKTRNVVQRIGWFGGEHTKKVKTELEGFGNSKVHKIVSSCGNMTDVGFFIQFNNVFYGEVKKFIIDVARRNNFSSLVLFNYAVVSDEHFTPCTIRCVEHENNDLMEIDKKMKDSGMAEYGVIYLFQDKKTFSFNCPESSVHEYVKKAGAVSFYYDKFGGIEFINKKDYAKVVKEEYNDNKEVIDLDVVLFLDGNFLGKKS